MKPVNLAIGFCLATNYVHGYPTVLDKRNLLLDGFANLFNSSGDLNATSISEGIFQDVKDLGGIILSLDLMIESVVDTSEIHGISGAFNYLKEIFESQTWKSIYSGIIKLVFEENGLETVIINYSQRLNNLNNTNARSPKSAVYPSANSKDAPYSLLEQKLRSAIEIPSGYEYGKGDKKPVLLVPGTGSYGGNGFYTNYIKLLNQTDFADVAWLNIPNYLLEDSQLNAEYVAYGVNYLSGISEGKKVSVISWSQGGLITQWALKYWPSLRENMGEFIPVAADFHGTELAPAICPSFPKLSCAPSVLQQEYNSNYVRTLRENDGDSAYVPTTSLFSGFDEIVQPQSKNASAALKDARNVGVGNYQFQNLCPNNTAGRYYTHEGSLYNPVGYALAADALKHGGVGDPSRIDLEHLCTLPFPEELDYADVLTTEVELLYCGFNIIFGKGKVKEEPRIRDYAK